MAVGMLMVRSCWNAAKKRTMAECRIGTGARLQSSHQRRFFDVTRLIFTPETQTEFGTHMVPGAFHSSKPLS